ncbi:MAG: tRNA (5-methylaminomethyl-2-thiouridine)(34)-methyltransferase MnmD [Flavobacteriaceae bacterium]
MKRKIITTSDGSRTIHIEEWNEHYHSKHGAIQEAYHVFIEAGLSTVKQSSLAILEMGFGTGLNAFITLLEAEKKKLQIDYTGVEAFPVLSVELEQLNYIEYLNADTYKECFSTMHSSSWEEHHQISPYFKLIKQQRNFGEVEEQNRYDLVYFDAFGARVQPELWTTKMFQKMYRALKSGGILVTYSAKGSVRRAMQSVGFKVERLPGPPGKREMLRAIKLMVN